MKKEQIDDNKDATMIPLPDTLSEFMDAPQDISKEEFLKKYGSEKIFKLKGYNKKKNIWSRNYCPKHNDIWSEGVYLTYEDAVSALMMRTVSCTVNEWVVIHTTVRREIENQWVIRFIRDDGKILIVKPDDDRITNVYTQKELLDRLVLGCDGKIIISSEEIVVSDKRHKDVKEIMKDICIDDIVLWVITGPNLIKGTGSWSHRLMREYEKEGPYKGELCNYIFSTYEEAVKKEVCGLYPQKTTLFQELGLYNKQKVDWMNVLYCGDKEILFVPKEIVEAKAIISDVKDNVENIRMENDIVSYLKESGMSEENIKKSVEKIKRNEDVLTAFHSYIMSMEYPETPVVEGYSPRSLHEEARDRLSPIEIMNYLIYLQEDPEAALRDLKERLSKK